MSNKQSNIVVIGNTGSGKTCLLNNILQKNVFKTHNELKVVVNEGYWLGDPSLGKVLCVDSPGGFIDQESKHEKELEQAFRVDFLKTVILNGVDALLLVLDINNPEMQFGMASTYAMLMLIFGQEIKGHTAIVFTHCDPDEKEKWVERKEKILKDWEKFSPVTTIDPKMEFPVFFTSMKTTDGLMELKQTVEKMGRFETDQIKKWREILKDPTKTEKDFEDAISQRFENCSIL